jgi:peptide-methionine (R)-S-oxide reductase
MSEKENAMNDAKWREKLDAEQYRVTRECGTEPAFSGKYYAHKADGCYLCVCCGEVLFNSSEKYDSGSGWPSFWAAAEEAPVGEKTDRSHGMLRSEIYCDNCGAHLGHVFPDGPQPSGLRYCVNSASLDFEPKASDSE